jgi:4-hydroxy-tetrahydrodipicolinate reductase
MGVGRMGQAVESLAPSFGHEVVAWLDSSSHEDGRGMAAMLTSKAEVAIDFTTAEAVVDNVRAATGVGLDVVVGTTGWYDRLDEVRDVVERAGKGLLYAPNFSFGVHAFFRLARELGRLADELADYDVALSETHHRNKADHPSGTAIRLAELLLAEIARKDSWSATLPDGRVPPETLQVAVGRSGYEAGTHSVIMDGPDDRIELTHRARGRTAFARGALTAAEWVRGRTGIFTLDDMLSRDPTVEER